MPSSVKHNLFRDFVEAKQRGTLAAAAAYRKEIRCLLGLFNPNSFSLVVDYDTPLEQQVDTRKGGCGSLDIDLSSEHFPADLSGKITVDAGRLLPSNRKLRNPKSTFEVLRQIDGLGLRPGNAHELVAFGREFPRAQADYHIVALGGRRWRNGFQLHHECVVCLWPDDRGFYLAGPLNIGGDNGYWGGPWSDYRFLVFPK